MCFVLQERYSGGKIRKQLKKCRTGHTEAIDGPSFDRQTIVSDCRCVSQDLGEKSGKFDQVWNYERQRRSFDQTTDHNGEPLIGSEKVLVTEFGKILSMEVPRASTYCIWIYGRYDCPIDLFREGVISWRKINFQS